jgi:hypothetical protein
LISESGHLPQCWGSCFKSGESVLSQRGSVVQKAAQAGKSRKVQQAVFYHGKLAVPAALVRLKDYLGSRFRVGKAEASHRLKGVS